MGDGFKLSLGVVLVAVVMLLLVVVVLVVLVVVVLGTRFGKDDSSSMVTSTALVWVSISNGTKVRDKQQGNKRRGGREFEGGQGK